MTLRSLVAYLVVTGAIVLAAYAAAEPSLEAAGRRAATVETTACGDASATSGAATLVFDDYVLAAAHVVIGATDLAVIVDGDAHPATLVRLDRRTDLALLHVPGISSGAVSLGVAEPDSVVHVVGGGPSGAFQTLVVRLVAIRIEEVRSTMRSLRRGFEVDVRVALGDSGAGVFDDDGRLVGVLFGRSTVHDDRSFAVRSSEIEALFRADDVTYRCDPEASQVERVN